MQHAYLVRYLYILVVIMANLKKDPLGLDLELNVTDGDLEGLDYDLRPPFVNGIGCPVPECGTHAYTSITSLWKHWSKFHRRHIVMFLCGHDSCTFKSPTKGLVLKHKTASKHISPHKTESVDNLKFRDPGDEHCPKRPSNLNIEGREAAKVERAKVEEVTQAIQPVVYNTRDEIVTISEGGPKITINPRWMKMK